MTGLIGKDRFPVNVQYTYATDKLPSNTLTLSYINVLTGSGTYFLPPGNVGGWVRFVTTSDVDLVSAPVFLRPENGGKVVYKGEQMDEFGLLPGVSRDEIFARINGDGLWEVL